MSKYFIKPDVSGTIKAEPGVGFTTIDIPFVPEYIKAVFHGPATPNGDDLLGEDKVYWDLTKVSETGYELTIAWSVYDTRKIYYRAAQLLVAPV